MRSVNLLIIACLIAHFPHVLAMESLPRNNKQRDLSTRQPSDPAKEKFDQAIAKLNTAQHLQSRQNKAATNAGITMLLQAGSAGYAPAYTELSGIYLNGIVVEKNEERAFKYALLACEKDPAAMHALGEYQARGIGVEVNFQVAAINFTAAARAGYPFSYYSLATLYQDGLGVEQNADLALKYFSLAEEGIKTEADQKTKAKQLAGVYLGYGEFYFDTKLPTYFNIAKAIEYLEKGAAFYAQGYNFESVQRCLRHLANIYCGEFDEFLLPKDKKRDIQRAAKFLSLAIKRGDSSCIYQLADLFFAHFDIFKANQALVGLIFVTLEEAAREEGKNAEQYIARFYALGLTSFSHQGRQVKLNKRPLLLIEKNDSPKEQAPLSKKNKKRIKKPRQPFSPPDLNQAPVAIKAQKPETKPQASLANMSIAELKPLANSAEVMYHLGSKYLQKNEVEKGMHYLLLCLNDKTMLDDLRLAAISLVKTIDPSFDYTDDFKYIDDPNSTFNPVYKFRRNNPSASAPSPYYTDAEILSDEPKPGVASPIAATRLREFEVSYEKDMGDLSTCVDRQAVENEIDANSDRGDIIRQEKNYRLMKSRFALIQGGKSGGGRIYYIVVNEHRPIRFLRAFKKSTQEDLPTAELNFLIAYFTDFVKTHGQHSVELLK